MANTMNGAPMTADHSATKKLLMDSTITEGREDKPTESLTVTNASASSSLTPALPELPYSLRDHKVGLFRPFATLPKFPSNAYPRLEMLVRCLP